MKNPSKAVKDQAFTLRLAGQNHKEIMEATGLSHSQMENHFMDLDLLAGVIPGGFHREPFASETAKTAWIAAKRLAGESWGLIAQRLQEPSSRVRTAFELSGQRSVGMRIGKGGAYLGKDQRFYAGADRAKLGTELTKAEAISAQVPANKDHDVAPVRHLPVIAKAAKVRKATKKA